MRYAKYIGRVGGLAVALGVGLAIAGVPADASAAPADAGTDSSEQTATTEAQSGSTAAPAGTTTNDGADAGSAEPDTAAGAETAPDDEAASEPAESEVEDVEADADPGAQSADATADESTSAASETTDNSRDPFSSTPAASSTLDSRSIVDDEITLWEASDDFSATVESTTDPAETPSTEQSQVLEATPTTATAPDATSTVLTEVSSLVGLTPTAPGEPEAPVDSPMEWAALAVARRELDSSALAAAEPINSPPQSAGVTQGAPDLVTGTITGVLNVTDPDGDAITYTLAEAPAAGALTLNTDGSFTYTPTQLARLNAGSTLTPDYDAFSVNASDGQMATDVPVTVEIYSGQMSTSTQAITVGAGPTAMAMSGDLMYVANTAGNSVSVIDTNTGSLLTTVPVGSRPAQLAVSSDGLTLYVAHSGDHTVASYSTATGTQLSSVLIGAPHGLALNPDSTRLYAPSTLLNMVVVLDTATGAPVAAIPVGRTPVGVVVNHAGTRVYVANRGSGSVSAIDATTNTVIGTATVGSLPQQVALSADGSRLYVTNAGSGSVSVVDTATFTTIATVPVGPSPNGIALSRDSSLAYVVNGNNTASVIDTATNTKVTGTIRIETGALGAVAVSEDGNQIYFSNSTGNTVRTISLIHVDPPPTYANPNTQAVFEDFNGPAGTLANPALFNYHLGTPGPGQQQVATDYPRNASLDGNGNLVVTAIEEPIVVPGSGIYNYTSASLNTRDKLEFTYGTVSARIKVPAEQGIHVGFFLLGQDLTTVGWPDAGEIDIAEIYSDDAHSGVTIHGPGGYAVQQPNPFPVSDEFHEYWMRWEPDKITVGIDDTVVRTFTPDDLPPGTPWTFNDRPMYIQMNLFVGGDHGQPDDTTNFPVSVVYDWVRYTPLDQSAGTTANPTDATLA